MATGFPQYKWVVPGAAAGPIGWEQQAAAEVDFQGPAKYSNPEVAASRLVKSKVVPGKY